MATSRMPTGVEGLDALLGGGLPDQRLTLLYGGTGVGKTVLALEVLVNNAKAGRPGIVVGFEEGPEELIENHVSFDWGLAEAADTNIHLMAARVEDEFRDVGAFDISGLLASIEAKIKQTAARWVLIDGLDALLGTLGDRVAAMRELFRLKHWLTDCGVAVIMTAKLDDHDSTGTTHFRDMPYVADCVIRLQNAAHKRTFARTLRVVKLRGGQSSSAEMPFVIRSSGVLVAERENYPLKAKVFDEQIGSGIERLDTMLRGGLIRGNSVLISGPPGAAKTSLAACFAREMAEAGERVLYISFDEAGEQIVEDLQSVSINLRPHVDSGLLKMQGVLAGATSAEAHYIDIHHAIREFAPHHVIVDPISALVKSGGLEMAVDVSDRLLDLAKATGITFYVTALSSAQAQASDMESHLANIVDVWIGVDYCIGEGERNRALSVIKARGINHSNQIRELTLDDNGPGLADVYIASGQMLMGSARLREEQEFELRLRDEQQAHERDRRRVEAGITQTQEQIATLTNQLDKQRLELEQLEHQAQAEVRSRDHDRRRLLHSRGADANDHRFSDEPSR
ncbi:circadian clock protein KaiC [Salinisphaera shabanensis]|uniref:circadian clock protein KaiC n=1 Tax=Salinisphaera shabanensis TaxID=180542 RepID=UPI001A7E2C2B|nr:circadian clock protein KaiC [Salinisphaera shabanensis]